MDVSDTPATVMSTLELNSEGLESVSDTLDIQSMEVDVVGQDGTPPDLNVSFTSLPRSKFSLEPSVVKVLSQERTAGVPLAKGSVSNHVQVEDTNNIETDTKLKGNSNKRDFLLTLGNMYELDLFLTHRIGCIGKWGLEKRF